MKMYKLGSTKIFKIPAKWSMIEHFLGLFGLWTALNRPLLEHL